MGLVGRFIDIVDGLGVGSVVGWEDGVEEREELLSWDGLSFELVSASATASGLFWWGSIFLRDPEYRILIFLKEGKRREREIGVGVVEPNQYNGDQVVLALMINPR